MRLIALALLLLTVSARAAPMRVFVLPAKGEGASAAEARALDVALTQALADADGLVVVSANDVQQLADLSAERTAADCTDAASSACLAEVAQGLGAELVVMQTVERLGGARLWQVSLFDQRHAGLVARATLEASDVAGLKAQARRAAATLVRPLEPDGVVAAPVDDAGGLSPLVVAGVATTAVGALTAVTGAVLIGAGAVIVPSDAYDTELRRSMQGAGPAFIGVAAVGALIAVVGAGVWIAGAVVDD